MNLKDKCIMTTFLHQCIFSCFWKGSPVVFLESFPPICHPHPGAPLQYFLGETKVFP